MSKGQRNIGTRSQLTFPDFFHNLQLQRSPLKDAKSALRNIDTTMESSGDESDDLMGLGGMKRPSSPSVPSESTERGMKRSKRDGVENEAIRPEKSSSSWRLEPFTSPAKLALTSGWPKSPQKTSWLGRAQSVPPPSSEPLPVPHLDLRAVPPSPWRSPSKKHPMLRVMSMPPSPSPPTDDWSDNDKTPTQSVKFDMSKPLPEGVGRSESSALGPFDFSRAAQNPLPLKTPVQKVPLSFMTPMSPLTPLPATPFHRAIPDSPESSQTPLPPAFNQSSIIDTTGLNRPSSPSISTYSASSSHLSSLTTISRLSNPPSRPPSTEPVGSKAADKINPISSSSRPTSSASFYAPSNATAPSSKVTATQKPPSSGATRTKATKTNERPTPVSQAGRMTRSITKSMKSRNEPIAVQKPRKSMSFSMYTTPRVVSNVASAKPKSRPSSPVKPSNPSAPPVAPSSPAVASTSSIVATVATATALARKNSSDVQPAKPSAVPTQTAKPIVRPPLSTTEDGGSRPASLSNLYNALEKLSLPAPSRPNTSQGFNPSSDDHSSRGDDIPSTDKGKVRGVGTSGMKSDSGIGRKSLAPAKPTGSSKKGATITSFFPPVGASSSPSSVAPATRSSALKAAAAANKVAIASRPSSMFAAPSTSKTTVPATSSSTHRIGTTFGGMKGRGGAVTSRIFGKGNTVVGSKIFSRVSKKSDLPVVEGSPVKGSASQLPEEDVDSVVPIPRSSGSSSVIDIPDEPFEHTVDMDRIFSELRALDDATDVKGKGKERHDDVWKKNASQRASLASLALSQSLSSLPQKTPPRLKGSMGPPPIPGSYPGLRSASSSYPSSAASGTNDTESAPGALGRGTGSHVSSGRTADGSSNGSGKKAAPRALKVLKKCTIFVDVKTEDGDDAGSLFVDMLKGLGARILSRVGQTCTHIVYKNGLTSTLSRYRSLDDPKPFVVGIAWVVDCAERMEKADETKYLIDLDGLNVAGVVKRRRSMLPKNMPFVPHESSEVSGAPSLISSASGSIDLDNESGMNEVERSPSVDGDDNLPPLERARRRRSMLVKG